MSTVRELQAAAQALQAAEIEAGRVSALIEERAPIAEAPAIDADQARQAYEDAAAAVALGDAPAELAATAKKALQAAEQHAADTAAKRRQAEALRAGLQRRADAAAVALEAARVRVRDARIAWAQDELQVADAIYAEHALRLVPAVARVSVLRDLLRSHGVPVGGPNNVADVVVLQAIGPASAQAVMSAQPWLPHGWGTSLARFDAAEVRQAVNVELEAVATASAPGGLKAALKRALRGDE